MPLTSSEIEETIVMVLDCHHYWKNFKCQLFLYLCLLFGWCRDKHLYYTVTQWKRFYLLLFWRKLYFQDSI